MSSQSSPAWVPAPMTPVEMPSSPSSDTHHDDDPVQQAHINVVSPYTPAPSPQPFYPPALTSSSSTTVFGPYHYRPSQSRSSSSDSKQHSATDHQSELLLSIHSNFARLSPSNRKRALADLLATCDIEHLVFVSNIIAPRLKRDFLRELPVEIALHILTFIDDPRVLARAGCVSRFWRNLLSDEFMWKAMCVKHNFASGMHQAYRSAMEGNMTWEARSVMMTSTSTTDALASAMEATAMVDDSRMLVVDPDSESDRPMRSPGASISSLSNEDNHGATAVAGPSSASSIASSSTFSRSNAAAGPSRLHLAARLSPRESARLRLPAKLEEQFSFRKYFKLAYLTEANWRRGGRVLKSHTSPDDGVVTSVAMNDDWIVVGLVNHRIHVFAADTGAHVRTLVGHTQGVWCLVLVTKGGSPAAASYARTPPTGRFQPFGAEPGVGGVGEDEPQFGPHLKPTDVCNTSIGWGQTASLVVSGGCDRDLRVWDVQTGYCLHALRGHTSTIRCLKVLDGRPIAVSGSRDSTLRVWDIQRGRCLHLLSGHTNSVRCLDVAGNIVVSGSYDCTARLWNADTGECLRVFEGHYHQIYAVAFDGIRVATGSLDSTVRVWSPETGACTALLQGHTSLVGQLQLSGDTLISGGSDGRVIIFSLRTSETRYRICAHDNSVTCLQFDDRFLITGGNDGHVKLFDVETGTAVRELTEPCEAVWRVGFRKYKCAIMCKRGGKTVMEILSFKPPEEAF